jgi:hypothetical protein
MNQSHCHSAQRLWLMHQHHDKHDDQHQCQVKTNLIQGSSIEVMPEYFYQFLLPFISAPRLGLMFWLLNQPLGAVDQSTLTFNS